MVSKADFSFLGPFLFASILILIFWGVILSFISAYSTVSIGSSMAFSLFGALLFCGFIVSPPPLAPSLSQLRLEATERCSLPSTQIYDTNQIINNMGVVCHAGLEPQTGRPQSATHTCEPRLGQDDYVIAAIELYLDVVNLFMYILMCSSLTGNN